MNSIELMGINQNVIRFEHLAVLYKTMLDNEDTKNAEKILDLYEKLDKNELMISFAGHFSAGKSSMINALMGEDILPKSPIPTSANVVKITSGEGKANVHLHNGDVLEFKEPYDMDRIKEYSKNKNEIKKIEINTSKPILPKQCSLMDTPGIDAADDADRIMTESSLHLIDVLFYVMDYNHVQSEVNLQFLRSVQNKSIPFYVIINQIDKHDENELSFVQFKQSISQTFKQWNIEPMEILYSSLTVPEVENNQFDRIQEILFQLMDRSENEKVIINHSTEQIVAEHQQFLKNRYESSLTIDMDEEEIENSLVKMKELTFKIKNLDEELINLEKTFNDVLQSTLNNAYLMPATLRDKAHSFLESQQSNFKVGFLASKKKTEAEREKRLTEFLQPLQDNMEASIQWKLRDKFAQLLNEYHITDDTILKEVQSLRLNYQADDLFELINPGAKVNGDYILNYTKEVTNDVKTKYKQRTNYLIELIKGIVTEKNRKKENKYKEQLQELEHAQQYNLKKEELKRDYNIRLSLLQSTIEQPQPNEDDWELLESAQNARYKEIQVVTNKEVSIKKNEKSVNQETVLLDKKEQDNRLPVEIVINSVDKTMKAIKGLPGFEALQKDLADKNDRLTNRSYTIALFGAFSAGKSSFANALIGENALPVSPNPTTAAVNRIRPVSNKYKHGTVVVTLKSKEALAKDLLMITKKYSPSFEEFDSLLQWVQDENIHQSKQLNKMYQAYLKALINGYDANKSYIGKEQIIDIEEFASYVTDETTACYIESIDLYYDCPITRQGITLVDTPGADSVNARHTNVAFEYIKHADAILYVTYYNHALSRADRDFIMQLGRVKEAFQLDKMFFIVNAADLAQDEGELSLVVNYVQEQLQALGVRLPRLYPVSSKRSLNEKQNQETLNDQMATFEEKFYQFMNFDLAALTIDSALWDIKRTYHAMNSYIESMNLDEAAKESRKSELYDKRIKLTEELVNIETSIYDDRIHDKIDKQLYYVLERLSIRFHDMFKEYFNPTTVTESGKKAIIQLRENLENLIEYVGYELYQELQAVSLRIEAFVIEQGNEVYDSMKKKSMETDKLFELPNWQDSELETPVYKEDFSQTDLSLFDKVITKFKGTKAFFEKNEKETMKEEMFDILSPLAKTYIEENKLMMVDNYNEQWNRLIEEMKFVANQSIDRQIRNYEEMMESGLDLSVLTEKQHQVLTELQKHGIEEVTS
ncbi:dynamin family protein [Oceanobacillus halophilus]|uniref:Dynamin N-terminal domain-containing protein n=1 Tax=Oceanobacillus halophilus TaxID=930130 RepID=A0A495ADA0_9BACI|nr:dynamin family protein [Oceanobacillus halophilus]RKQ37590.1 hypothetical protein D8M06_01930 [Oceanobacillus halophilus]